MSLSLKKIFYSKSFSPALFRLILTFSLFFVLSPQTVESATDIAAPTPTPSLPVCVETLADIVEKVSPGVVNISSITVQHLRVLGLDNAMRLRERLQKRQSASLGSGLLLDQAGYILTNRHVVAKATQVMITLLDQRELEATIVGSDEKTDIALLKINPVPNLFPITLGQSSQVRVGESVFAIGNPAGLSNTVTRGIISGKNRAIGIGPFDNFLQTDASINPGNSGGGLFNLRGEAIGVNTAIHSPTGQSSGLGFAIPIDEAKKLIPGLIKYGRVIRPWLGIGALKIQPLIAEHYQLPTREGIIVMELVPGEPASKAGLKEGDIITEINGKKVTDVSDIEKHLDALDASQWNAVSVKCFRKNKSLTLSVTVRERPFSKRKTIETLEDM